MIRLSACVVALATAALCSATASADTLEVPSEFPTIQAAIDAALDGDTVRIAPGEYVESIDLLGKAITVTGHDPLDPLVVAQTRLERFSLSAVTCASGETPSTVLAGITIHRSGTCCGGGGISILDSSPRIEHCRIEQCSGGSPGGGAIYVNNGSPELIGCTFHDNDTAFGAAILAEGGAVVTVTDCTFQANRGFQGAGMRLRGGAGAVIDGSRFAENEVHGAGAALNIDAGCPVTIGATEFCGNVPSSIVGDFTDAGGNTFEETCTPSTISVPFDAPTIQLGILLAMDGQEVVVEPGVYNEAIDLLGRAIVLRSFDPADPVVVAGTVVDATGLDAPAVTCAFDETESTVVAGLTFTGGTGAVPPGGSLPSGGGAFIGRGPGGQTPQPRFESCRFVGNAVEGGGGGAYAENEVRPTFVDCLFAENFAGMDGGGLFVFDHETGAHVIGSTFEANVAADRGGAVFVWGEDMDVIIDDCAFRENIAHAGGAVMYIDPDSSVPVPVSASSFCGNRPDDVVGNVADAGGNVYEPFCVPIGEGRTIVVPDDEPTVVGAVAAALDGDTVLVRPGTYVGSVNLAGKAITLAGSTGGAAGEDLPVIDAAGSGSAIICNSGETAATVIRDLTVRGGIGTPDSTGEVTGGGIHISSASPRIENVVFLDNIGAEDGGGLAVDGGSPSVIDCAFVANVATDDGGAAAIRGGGSVLFSGCTFSLNSSSDEGGGIRVRASFANVFECTFEGNEAGDQGGAIAANLDTDEGDVSVEDSRFCGNTPQHIAGDYLDAGGNDFVADCDLDGDGLLDSWEIAGIPYVDADGQDQLYVLEGANPERKDIFVEIDAMSAPGIAPSSVALHRVKSAFARAPVENPDGSRGINLHLDIDETNIATFDFDPGAWSDFDVLKVLHFGTTAERDGEELTVINRLEAKKKAFRYCIFGSMQLKPDGSGGTEPTSISGRAEIGGNDFMVTLGHPGWAGGGGTARQKAGTFMHELGHTLGLRHGGPESELSSIEMAGPDIAFNFKPNYYSIMNYQWQMPQPWQKPGSWPLHGFNSGYALAPLRDLDETDVSEELGLVDPAHAGAFPAAGFWSQYNAEEDSSQPPNVQKAIIKPGAGMDFDQDGTIEDPKLPLFLDLNHLYASMPASPDRLLQSHSDWEYLDYDFKDNPQFADGVHLETDAVEELTFEIYQQMSTALPAACVGDIITDGVVDVMDLLELLAKWGPCAEGTVCVHDLDDDGAVGVGDLLSVLAAWGPCP